MRISLLISLMISVISSVALATPTAQQIDGTYQTLQAERGKNGQPTNKILMQLANLNGQQVLVTAGCHPGCTPIVYSYLAEQSQTLQKAIYFSKAGIYLIQVKDGAFVSVIPDAQLGMKPWKNLRFVNVYAKEGMDLPFDLASATQFVLDQSKAIMNTGTLTEMTHGSGEYHIAAPIKVMGKSHQKATISFTEGKEKSISIKACERCPADTYQYLPDETGLTGTPTYKSSVGNILFDVSDGVILWANFKGNYGKQPWQSNNHFNIYAKDIGYVRAIRADKSKQTNTDELIAKNAQLVKTEMDRRQAQAQAKKIANQTLPDKGMRDANLEKEATAAAERWAKNWGWKETIAYAYFTSADWGINHHPLTGLVTGRHIRGIIVMRRPDGMCSFHYASFGQEYDGSNFTKTHMLGLTPGQIQLGCEKI